MTALPKRMLFSSQHLHRLDDTDLIQFQEDSFKQFIEEYLSELFEEISPIEDFTGKNYELHFSGITYDAPKMSELEALQKEATYSCQLKARVRLIIKETGEIKEQTLYLGDLPWMTSRGAFIINGTERVIVNQLIRSPGVYFTVREGSSYGKTVYSAKIIPDRGAWVEFETSKKGTITVKIDRKRKILVTAFLRALGFSSDQEILDLFEDYDIGDHRFIQSTLEKDSTKTRENGLLEVYKKLRPGEPATVESAEQLIYNLFFSYRRYSLGRVGRYKVNERLNITLPNTRENRMLRKEDIIAVLRELIQLNNGIGKSDDIDHLGNRRVRGVGELVRNQFRIGILRMERIVRERMSIIEEEKMSPHLLVNVKPIVAVLQEFFGSSQLSQFMDQTNPISELGHKRRLSALGPGGLTREQAGFEVRDVHASHYGRVCPIETPEGPNIGLINALASHARINKYGFIETPYRKVERTISLKKSKELIGRTIREDVLDGKKAVVTAGTAITEKILTQLEKIKGLEDVPVRPYVSSEFQFMGALEEEKYVIARVCPLNDHFEFLDSRVEARIGEKFIYEDVNNIDLMDIASNQIVGVSASLIPFLEHDDANRALMGANMQRQAVPLIRAESPLVGTGIEAKLAVASGEALTATEAGEVVDVDANMIVVKNKEGKKQAYTLRKFFRTNQGTTVNQYPSVDKGQKVVKGQVLNGSYVVEGGELALGHNVLVAFMSFEGYNFEDAIIISDRLVKQDYFSSVHIEKFEVELRDTKLGIEEITRDIPNVSEEALRYLDDEGIISVGAVVTPGDILVGKITPKGETELSPEEKLLRAIFGDKARDVKDSSLRMPNSFSGKVVNINRLRRSDGNDLPTGVEEIVQVFVARTHKISVGDKMAGRHGNKGVISIVLPESDMPYLADGTPVDIILNPLGVPSRMNLGQLFETHLGWAAHELGYKVASPVFDGVTFTKIQEELTKAKLPESGKIRLWDGKTGEPFDQEVTVGYIYMLKLHHLAEDKIHARSVGPYSLVTQQPLGGKTQFGGQRFGEMEVWALEAYGAANVLQEMLTIKSDDVHGRMKAYEAIVKGDTEINTGIPESFNVLVRELQSLGIAVKLGRHEGDQHIEVQVQYKHDDVREEDIISSEQDEALALEERDEDDLLDEDFEREIIEEEVVPGAEDADDVDLDTLVEEENLDEDDDVLLFDDDKIE